MKKWITIIGITILFLVLPQVGAAIKGIQLSKVDLFFSRIKLSFILILYGAICKIFAVPLGTLSFKTAPKFMKNNSSVEKFIDKCKSGGFDLIISGILVVLAALIIRVI